MTLQLISISMHNIPLQSRGQGMYLRQRKLFKYGWQLFVHLYEWMCFVYGVFLDPKVYCIGDNFSTSIPRPLASPTPAAYPRSGVHKPHPLIIGTFV